MNSMLKVHCHNILLCNRLDHYWLHHQFLSFSCLSLQRVDNTNLLTVYNWKVEWKYWKYLRTNAFTLFHLIL